MNSLRLQIDSQFGEYAFTRGAEELFVRYKKRKNKIKALSTSVSAVCVVLFIALFADSIGNLFSLSADSQTSLSVTAYALDNADSKATVSSKKSLIKDSNGVQKKKQRVVYSGANGREILDDTAKPKSGDTVEKRTVIVPSPISFKISGDKITSYSVECSGNGSLYSESASILKKGKIPYKGNKVVNWIPNCEKLTKDLTADITMVPSTLKNDRLASKEIDALLKTAKDYTKYFGGTVKITANYSDKTSQTITTKITLDEKGRYYVSTL